MNEKKRIQQQVKMNALFLSSVFIRREITNPDTLEENDGFAQENEDAIRAEIQKISDRLLQQAQRIVVLLNAAPESDAP